MSKIVQLKKEGINEYPITIPEAVIDSNGITVKDKIKNLEDTIKNIQPSGGSYDDTKLKEDIAILQHNKADKSELVIKKSVGTGSALQEVEVETFTDETPDSPTSGQEIPTEASGNHSVVLNGKSHASGKRALAHGNRTIAQGENSHTEGHCTQTIYVDEVTNGYAAHAEGYGTLAGGTYSHTEGNKTKTAAPNSHAEGYLSVTMPEAESAHAEGYETSAEAPASHTEGNNTKTSRAYSHAEGRKTETIGEASHTEGNDTITEGDYAHAEGWMTRAKGAYSHSEGQYTFTYADAAHSEGNNTHAQAPFSHAEGLGTKTNPDIIGQHVEGYYNAESDGVKVIGCGTADDARMNAVEVKQDGRVFVKGLGNYDGTNSNEAADLKHTIDTKANSGDVYNKTEMRNIIDEDLVQKSQVATINGKSLVDGGNIVIEGGSSTTPDWNAQEDEAGYIKNKPFYINADYTINKGGEYNDVPNGMVIFNNKVLFDLRNIAYNYVVAINSGPPVTLEKKYNDYGGTKLIIEDVGNYLSTYPIVIGNLVTIPEILIPDTIARKSDLENSGGGADWNAEEGEVGYIKNKPFNLVIQNIDFELYDEKACAYISDIYEYDGFCILDKPLQFNGNYNFTIDYYEGFEQYQGITIEFQSSDILVTPNHIDTYVGDTIEGFVDYCNSTIKLFKIKVIDALFISDTVLKTTPQELSDEDKNQALANLGIADLLEALKPVRLSEEPPIGNVTQEQLDEIGLTEKVINNILNGYTNKIYIDGAIYYVTSACIDGEETLSFAFANFTFSGANIDTFMQYEYCKHLDEITIKFLEL